MRTYRRLFAVAVASWILNSSVATFAADFNDPLSTAAELSRQPDREVMTGLARAGKRLVAVGLRGQIVVSDDAGATWRQVKAPVSSDLVAACFPSEKKGWIVAHDGVVLASADGGNGWVKQLDGYAVARAMTERYVNTPMAAEAKRFAEQGPDKPFLDIWFDNDTTGTVVGAYNLIFHTVDGGKNWTPWLDRTDNPKMLHLYAIRRIGQDYFIVGEQGLVLRLDDTSGRFRALDVPYKGTFFGIAGKPGAVVAYGLRGNVFRTTDRGKSWTKIETGLSVSLVGSALTDDGRIVLVSQAGHVLDSSDNGESFRIRKFDRPHPSAAVIASGERSLLIAGMHGLRIQSDK